MNTSQRRTTAQRRRPDAWEWRRQRAWELHEHGWWQKDIAAALGVSRAAVCQWLRRRREGGADALRTRPQPGRTARLTAEQRAEVPGLLARGAEAYGFRGDVWTARRVAVVNLAHLWRPLAPRSCQPLVAPGGLESPAAQHTGHAARRGGHSAVVDRALAGPPKKAADEGSTVVWVDEAGFYLLPMAVRTWAPRGQTPIRHVTLTPDHLAATSGITLDGRLYLQTREDAFDAQGVVGFLRVRLAQAARQGPGHLGWVADPQGAADQGLPHARRRQAPAPGTLARLRARPQSRRGHRELSQARRTQEPLLPRLGRTPPRAAPRQRALAPQARHHQGVFGPMWLLGLANDVEVSRYSCLRQV